MNNIFVLDVTNPRTPEKREAPKMSIVYRNNCRQVELGQLGGERSHREAIEIAVKLFEFACEQGNPSRYEVTACSNNKIGHRERGRGDRPSPVNLTRL